MLHTVNTSIYIVLRNKQFYGNKYSTKLNKWVYGCTGHAARPGVVDRLEVVPGYARVRRQTPASTPAKKQFGLFLTRQTCFVFYLQGKPVKSLFTRQKPVWSFV